MDALYRAICENPEDDTIRLVYADWFEENGDPTRAEFIRVQMELERSPRSVTLQERSEQLRRENPAWGGAATLRAVFRRGFVDSIGCYFWDVFKGKDDREVSDFALSLVRQYPLSRFRFYDKWPRAVYPVNGRYEWTPYLNTSRLEDPHSLPTWLLELVQETRSGVRFHEAQEALERKAVRYVRKLAF